MARSIKKGYFVDEKLLKKVQEQEKNNSKKIIKTWSRRSVIIPAFLSYTFAVHNGKEFIPVYVKEEMIGHRLGEFSLTRKFGLKASRKK